MDNSMIIGNMKTIYMYINQNELSHSDIFKNITFTKFQTFVRNLISKKVIDQPEKIGRSLVYTIYNIKQIIIAKRYMLSGSPLLALPGYLVDMIDKDIEYRLTTTQLPDIIKIATAYRNKVKAEKELSPTNKIDALISKIENSNNITVDMILKELKQI